MKKSKLIEMLSKIEGDPNIVFFNGFTKDWMDIDKVAVPIDVYKQTFDDYVKMVELEHKIKNNDVNFKLSNDKIKSMKKYYDKKFDWEENVYITEDDVKQKRYKKKTFVYLNAVPRDKTKVGIGPHGLIRY